MASWRGVAGGRGQSTRGGRQNCRQPRTEGHHTCTHSHSSKPAHTCTKQTLKHTPHMCTHRYTCMYFIVYSQMQDKHTIAYTHVCMRVSTHTLASPGTYALVCTCAHTHIHVHACYASVHRKWKDQVCERNRENDGAERGHGPTGLIYREVTVTLSGAASGAKRVEKVAGKERVQGV